MRHQQRWQVMVLAALAVAVMACGAWAAAGAIRPAPTPPAPAPTPPAPAPTPPAPSPTPSGKFAPPPMPVTVTILGIRATSEPTPTIDAELAPIANELRSSKFNSFRLAARGTQTVAVGDTASLSMIEGYSLRVQPEKVAADRVTMVLTWLQTDRDAAGGPQTRVLARVSMQIARGKYLLWGQWKLKEGALLGAVAVR